MTASLIFKLPDLNSSLCVQWGEKNGSSVNGGGSFCRDHKTIQSQELFGVKHKTLKIIVWKKNSMTPSETDLNLIQSELEAQKNN